MEDVTFSQSEENLDKMILSTQKAEANMRTKCSISKLTPAKLFSERKSIQKYTKRILENALIRFLLIALSYFLLMQYPPVAKAQEKAGEYISASVRIVIDCRIKQKLSDGTFIYNDNYNIERPISSKQANSSWSGNILTASWSKFYNEGDYLIGDLTVILNDNHDRVLSFYGTSKISNSNLLEEFKFSGTDIPFTRSYETYDQFMIYGEETASHISSLSWKSERYQKLYLVSYSSSVNEERPDYTSRIRIRLNKKNTNLRVKEITATNDIEMEDVPKPLWQTSYNEFGNNPSIVGGDRPVAAQLVSGQVYLPIKLIAFPDDFGDDSHTFCDWKVVGTNMQGRGLFKSKSGVIEIKLPSEIGIYQLDLNFRFFDNQWNRISEQKITLPLWVSYQAPGDFSIKRKWLEKAIQWAAGYKIQWSKGSINDHELAEKIMQSIYKKSGWQYYTHVFVWKKLFDGTAPLNGGNCIVVANVWQNLLKALGVGGVSILHHEGRTVGLGFMLNPDFVAFGGLKSAPGNAAIPYTFYPTWDRWVFSGHTFGKKGNTYYDPTFNKSFTDFYFHVAYDVIKKEPEVWTTSAGGPKIWEKRQFDEDDGNWNSYIYEFPSSQNQTQALKSRQSQGARFTGSFLETTLDPDGDGFFNQLGATVGVEITSPGNYTVSGVLRKNGTTITSRPYLASPSSWIESIGPQTGLLEIQSLFSGEDIFDRAQDGTYDMQLFIKDSTGAVTDVDTFTTTPYTFSNFGELPTRLSQISEIAKDTTGDGFIDEILTNFDIQTSLADNYTIEASLSHGNQTLVSENEIVGLNVGSNPLVFSLPSVSISQAGLDGPYTLSIQVSDKEGIQTAYGEIQTSSYLASQFTPPIIRITGGSSDQGIDTDGNGLFDSLQVSLDLEALEAGNFTVRTWLANPDGEVVAWAESNRNLSADSSSILLSFPGLDINVSQLDGPYTVSYSTVAQDSFNLVYSATDIYATQEYNFSQFEEAEGPLITATGSYSESTIDSDLDGLIDSLVVEIEVVPGDSGNVIGIGRLVDSEGETILWSSTVEFLQEGSPQLLNLPFDGRYIYAGLVNGPYQLQDLLIYHVGDASQRIDVVNPFTTQFYNFEDFESAGVITGTISDSTGNAVPNAFLTVSNADIDYSNTVGKYNIVIVNDGDYRLNIEGPDNLDVDWSIFVNETFAGTGDSVRVSVNIGQIVNVDFIAPIIITEVDYPVLSSQLPSRFQLHQNYPNPFNPETRIQYDLPKSTLVRIEVFNLLGQKIRTLIDEQKPAGNYTVVWDGQNENGKQAISGVYIYRLKTNEFEKSRKLLLLK